MRGPARPRALGGGIRVFWLFAAQTHPPYWLQFPIDWRVFSVSRCDLPRNVCSLWAGTALYTARTNVVEAMTRGVTGGRRGRRWSAALVVGQLALTLVLLSGAGAMVRNILMLSTTDPGVDTTSLVRLRLDLPSSIYNAPDQRSSFYRRLDERLERMQGLRSSIANVPPASGGASRQLLVDGRPDPEPSERPNVTMVTIGDRYFDTIGARHVRGRLFGAGDGESGRGAAIVNERFAAMHFGSEGAIGKRIRLAAPGRPAAPGSAIEWMTIVGVVANVQQRPPNDGSFDPVVYVPLAANPDWSVNILVRGSPEPGVVSSQVQDRYAPSTRTSRSSIADGRQPARVSAVGRARLRIDVRDVRGDRPHDGQCWAVCGDGVRRRHNAHARSACASLSAPASVMCGGSLRGGIDSSGGRACRRTRRFHRGPAPVAPSDHSGRWQSVDDLGRRHRAPGLHRVRRVSDPCDARSLSIPRERYASRASLRRVYLVISDVRSSTMCRRRTYGSRNTRTSLYAAV